jgi:hypothetical protein
MRILLVALLVIGCKHRPQQTPVDPAFDAFEKKWVANGDVLIERAQKEAKPVTDADRKGLEAYHGIFIDKTGVIIDRKRVATLEELRAKRDQLRSAIDQNIAFMPTVRNDAMVVFDLGDQPAQVAIDALDLFVYKKIGLAVPGGPEDPLASSSLCSDQLLEDTPRSRTDKQRLSIYLAAKSIWVGVSVINEFQEIVDKEGRRDLDQLKTTLQEHKMSEAFHDRYDIELAADGGTAADVIASLGVLCDEFTDIAILPPDKLSAKPMP